MYVISETEPLSDTSLNEIQIRVQTVLKYMQFLQNIEIYEIYLAHNHWIFSSTLGSKLTSTCSTRKGSQVQILYLPQVVLEKAN